MHSQLKKIWEMPKSKKEANSPPFPESCHCDFCTFPHSILLFKKNKIINIDFVLTTHDCDKNIPTAQRKQESL